MKNIFVAALAVFLLIGCSGPLPGYKICKETGGELSPEELIQIAMSRSIKSKVANAFANGETVGEYLFGVTSFEELMANFPDCCKFSDIKHIDPKRDLNQMRWRARGIVYYKVHGKKIEGKVVPYERGPVTGAIPISACGDYVSK